MRKSTIKKIADAVIAGMGRERREWVSALGKVEAEKCDLEREIEELRRENDNLMKIKGIFENWGKDAVERDNISEAENASLKLQLEVALKNLKLAYEKLRGVEVGIPVGSTFDEMVASDGTEYHMLSGLPGAEEVQIMLDALRRIEAVKEKAGGVK